MSLFIFVNSELLAKICILHHWKLLLWGVDDDDVVVVVVDDDDDNNDDDGGGDDDDDDDDDGGGGGDDDDDDDDFGNCQIGLEKMDKLVISMNTWKGQIIKLWWLLLLSNDKCTSKFNIR